MVHQPRVEITFCTQCRWLLRAGWMAQELLTTFNTELGEVALVPGTGGIFEVRVDDELISECRVVTSGRRVGVSEITVTNQDGKLIAKATGTTIPVG